MLESDILILPGTDEYKATLSMSRPPNWKETAIKGDNWHAHVADHQTGLLRTVTFDEMIEYTEGGEYDQVVSSWNELEID